MAVDPPTNNGKPWVNRPAVRLHASPKDYVGSVTEKVDESPDWQYGFTWFVVLLGYCSLVGLAVIGVVTVWGWL